MVNRRGFRWLAWGVLWVATSAWAQPAGSIRGVVYDNDFDAPLPNPVVTIAETGARVTGTPEGNFLFEQVPPGTYTLIVSKDGYTRQVRPNVVVTEGQLVEVESRLSGEFTEMDEFLVQDLQIGGASEEGLLNLRAQSPSFLDSVGADLLSKAGASDAAAALTLVSGATVQDGKFAVVRGLPDRYVNSQLNGVRLPSADDETRAVELDQFPAAVIESVQVSKTFTPDQQGDASGGAVNLILKGIPNETVFQFTSQVSYNTQVTGRDDFLSYKGGGLTYFGFKDGGDREIHPEWLTGGGTGRYGDAVGVSRDDAPIDYKYGLTLGGKHEFDNGVKLGALLSFFYERDSSFFDNGTDDEYVLDRFTNTLVPKTSRGSPSQGEFLTSLFDVERSSQEVKWGTLGVFGMETQYHQLKLAYLYTRSAEDQVTLAEDTRGKPTFYPGYDPINNQSPGFDEPLGAPYLRNETLEYTERTTQSLQLSGRHTLPLFETDTEPEGLFGLLNPEVDWTFALSEATFLEPDKRLFSTLWTPPFNPATQEGLHQPLAPAANINLGNLQRTFRDISEDGTQLQVNLKMPFTQWTQTPGYAKVGLFRDRVERQFDQESFSNFGDAGSKYTGDFDELWSEVFPSEVHRVTDSDFDTDYSGNFDVDAVYWMVDLPLTQTLKLVGGIRYEQTKIITEVDPDLLPNGAIGPTYIPPPPAAPVQTVIDPAVVNVDFQQDDVLPAIGLAWDVVEQVTLRVSYAETVARQTFRELTPIQQQEYLGGDVFVGNPTLEMAALKNYDFRADFKPAAGSLFSVSYFFKDVDKPIEYIQRATADSGTFTTPVNYPSGTLSGWELELRQDLGAWREELTGLSFGGNATLIDSEVQLPQSEINDLIAQGFPVSRSRDATNAPELLYNIYVTYALERTGTEFALFYTVRGDTLVAGSGIGDKGFIPDVYEKEYGTLNFSVAQKLGQHFKLKFQAKNLTDPELQEVYRYNGQDTVKTSYTKGIDLSLSISAEFQF